MKAKQTRFTDLYGAAPFRQAAWVKPLIIFIMLLVLLIPLAFIRALVSTREQNKQTAEASIMEPAGGEPMPQDTDAQNASSLHTAAGKELSGTE